MAVYDELGVRPIINAVGPATRLGGLPWSPGLLAAVARALTVNARMDDLEDVAGAGPTRLLEVPAVDVTSGASAPWMPVLCCPVDLITVVGLRRTRPWHSVPGLAAVGHLRRAPLLGRHGLGCGMKVGWEQIGRVLAAVREFFSELTRSDKHYALELATCGARLTSCPTLTVSHSHKKHLDVPVLSIDFRDARNDADSGVRSLDIGEPRAHLGEDVTRCGVLVDNPTGAGPGQGVRVGRGIADTVLAYDDKERS